jgi:hypothetical protein
MKKLLLISLLLLSCQQHREIDSIVLDVPYPAQQSLVRGGYCLYGAFWLVDPYLDGYEIDLSNPPTQHVNFAPYPDAGEAIAAELFGMPVQLRPMRFYQLERELWAGRPVVLLFRGADKGDVQYSDAVVLVGLRPDGAILHYPVWPWTGSGAYVFVEWARFYQLYTGWGYRIL